MSCVGEYKSLGPGRLFQGIDDIVGFVVGRILVALGVEETLTEELQYRPDEA